MMNYLAEAPRVKEEALELSFGGYPSMAIIFGSTEREHTDNCMLFCFFFLFLSAICAYCLIS
jgi:hypothetical protein